MANTKNKTILVHDSGAFFEIALALADHYKQVLYYVPWESGFPSPDKARVGTEWVNGKQLDTFDGKAFKRVPEFFEALKEADIVFFTDCYNGDLMEHLREMGYPVCGSGRGQILELDRWLCKQTFKAAGMDVNPMKRVTGMTALRELLKKEEDRYIKISRYRKLVETFHHETYQLSEAILDKMQHELGPMAETIEFIIEEPIEAIVEEGIDCYTVDGKYPKNTLAGTEVKDRAYYGEIMDYDKLSPGVQRTTNQISPMLKKYQYKGFFSTEVRTTKDKENYLSDMTCFSDDTEVLTKNGWKLFKDCLPDDEYCTLNINTDTIEYQKCNNAISYHYKGNMIQLYNSGNTYNQLVTPNHNILRYDRHKKRLFKEEAGKLTDKGYIPRTASNWKGNDQEFFILPEYHKEWYSFYPQVCHKPALNIKMIDWASFLGWFLSEGAIGHGHVTITQFKSPQREIIKELLKKLPFNFTEHSKGFQIQSTQLLKYLKKYGKCNQKYVPDYIKNSSKEVIEAFLNAYRLGDGTTEYGKNKELLHKRIFTTSHKIADDIQECLLKIGKVGNISKMKNNGKGSKMSVKGSNIYERNHDIIVISENISRKHYWFETGSRKLDYIKEVPYDSNVYCVSVPNEILYVRRDGKPTWSGNCRLPMPPSPLYTIMFENLGEIIWGIANGEIVDIKPKYKCGLYVTLYSDFFDSDHQPVWFPKEYRDNVKISYPIKVDGKYTAININGFPEVGSVVVGGNSFEECYKLMEKIAPEVKGYGLKIEVKDCEVAKGEFDKMMGKKS